MDHRPKQFAFLAELFIDFNESVDDSVVAPAPLSPKRALGHFILCNPTKKNSSNPCPFYNLIKSGVTIETQRAYIAGIVDGEGTITIKKRNVKRKSGVFCFYTCVVIVVNTDKKMLDFIANLYEGWININRRLKGNQRRSYIWVCGGDNMRKLLKDIFPYLIIKKKQAKIVLQFPIYEHTGWGWKGGRSEAQKKKQDNLWIRMKELNRRGVSNANKHFM